ncbi:hypothetical protein DIE14_24795 [Burkholderia sp. Bp9017]|nr:hypothetical protein DIE14_24795 [Burkholderia sp. Bp9017]RQZ36186.1 hypothetical protein DIE13_06410 [Burkholderia sp. Bp9016]
MSARRALQFGRVVALRFVLSVSTGWHAAIAIWRFCRRRDASRVVASFEPMPVCETVTSLLATVAKPGGCGDECNVVLAFAHAFGTAP